MATSPEVPLPLVIHPRVRKAIRRGSATACLAMLAGAGTALADCPAPPTGTPFARWGDANSYFAAPGGRFEGSAQQVGWHLRNADLTAGNQPFALDGPADTQSLTIDAGGRATSPFFCVDDTMTSLRFFARQAAPGGDLRVRALVRTPEGIRGLRLARLADGSAPDWAPTEPIGGDAPRIPHGHSAMVALRFSVPWWGGSWQIDDVEVDPYRSG